MKGGFAQLDGRSMCDTVTKIEVFKYGFKLNERVPLLPAALVDLPARLRTNMRVKSQYRDRRCRNSGGAELAHRYRRPIVPVAASRAD
jgi:hypothetical protein